MELEKNKVYQGDSLEVLKTFSDESIDCCITSPPYWGLRDYGTAKWEGGDVECDHKGAVSRNVSGADGLQYLKKGKEKNSVTSGDCACGAKRIDSQLGLEKTPEEYVEKMVVVFREVRRVLKKDGTCWLNLGDSYAAGSRSANPKERPDLPDPPSGWGRRDATTHSSTIVSGLKPKDLCGIPWRVAFALQADGWWLRQDIIWHKPNPMPESVTDRCTKSHEYIFLLTKSAKYYYDHEAIQEDIKYPGRAFSENHLDVRKDKDKDVYAVSSNSQNKYYEKLKDSIESGEPLRRNKRSVWTVSTKPFSEAHFATFPPDLIEPCVLTTRKDAVILDLFMGAGTVGVVASKLGRDYVGIELNPEYIEMANQRISETTRQMKIF